MKMCVCYIQSFDASKPLGIYLTVEDLVYVHVGTCF